MENETTNLTAYVRLQPLTTSCTLSMVNVYLEEVDSMMGFSVVFLTFHCITSVTAVLGNGVFLLAIWKTPSLHSPSIILLCCLALTDFLTGLLTQPSVVAELSARIVGAYETYCLAYLVNYFPCYILSGMSFLTLTLISLDGFLALQLHLRYQGMITIPRYLVVEGFFFILMIIVSIIPFFATFLMFQIVIACIISPCLGLSVIAYIKIARSIAKQEARIQTEAKLSAHLHGGSVESETRKLKRSSKTMAALFFLFCLCYTPILCVMVASVVLDHSKAMPFYLMFGYEFGGTAVFVNSSINPIIYCLRMRGIKQAIVKLLWRQNTVSDQTLNQKNLKSPRVKRCEHLTSAI